MYQLSDLFILFLLTCVVLVWWHNARFKETALRHAQRYCEQYNLQLLDEGMAIARIWPARSRQGSMVLRRTYQFEFATTGDRRYTGTLTLLGANLEQVYTPPHQIH